MAARKLKATEIGIPIFEPSEVREGDVFQLSSHRRARQALEFALGADGPEFNVFVLGPDRSGRMTATVDYLQQKMLQRPPPDDWIYLANFSNPEEPLPIALAAGQGQRFQARMMALLPQLREALVRAFGAADYERQLEADNDALQSSIAEALEELRVEARSEGLDIQQAPNGFSIVPVGKDGNPVPLDGMPTVRRKRVEAAGRALSEKLRDLKRFAAKRQMSFAEKVADMNRQVAEHAVGGLIDEMIADFAAHEKLVVWLEAMRGDILENLSRFRPAAEGANPEATAESPERRYAVNLLVDHSKATTAPVYVEPEPSLETLFGHLAYRQAGGILETDFSMIRAGALHKANGGVLVLRADGLAAVPGLWPALKAALRDQCITLTNPLRSGAIPIAGMPKPKAIPLDVKIVLVGAPKWYYTFFSFDPEFQTHFGIKADIDADMEANPENLASYAGLVQDHSRSITGRSAHPKAVARLMGMSARWAGDRGRLSAQFELIEDVLRDAGQLAPTGRQISLKAVNEALASRRSRNARIEDRLHDQITEGTVMIDVAGQVRGQVNALTVRDMGDHAFGTPARVTARASIGRRGVINVERDISLGGPIQQKGAMVVQGFLAGRFARRYPLSFNCSITFEQSYGGVEGDSASLAELVAIISELSGLPVRQDLAITGSVNQLGVAQAVGGVHHKIEGFFRCCRDRGELTGTQGVVIPRSNEANLLLNDPVAAAVRRRKFHIWSVESIDEAVELFFDTTAGVTDRAGDYPPESIYGRVALELERFDAVMRGDRAE